MANGAKARYDVEHVWANHPERHTDEFNHEADIARHRNRIDDLLLLPKQFNASYNDDPYEKKAAALLRSEPARGQPQPAELREEPRVCGLRQVQQTPVQAL